jgi:hypothetical protein
MTGPKPSAPLACLTTEDGDIVWLFQHERDARAWIPLVVADAPNQPRPRVRERKVRALGRTVVLWVMVFGPDRAGVME